MLGLPRSLSSKEASCNSVEVGLIPGSGRSPGGRHGNPLQYSCLENPHVQRSLVGNSPWGGATVHCGRLSKSRTQLKQLSMHRSMLKLVKQFIYDLLLCPALDLKSLGQGREGKDVHEVVCHSKDKLEPRKTN